MAGLDLSGFDEVTKETTTKPLDLSHFDTAMTAAPTAPQTQLTQQTEPNQPGQMEALLRGGAQGLALEHADELTGLLESLVSNKSYEQARDESRAAYKAAEEAHPMTYVGGEIVGGLAIPGLGELKGAKGLAKLGLRAAEGATMGGIGAMGASEKEGTEMLKEGGKGAVLGGTIAPVFGAMLDKVVPVTKSIVSQFADPDLARIAYNKARSGESLAGKEALAQSQQKLFDFVREDLMPTVLDDSKKVVGQAYDEALAIARKEGRGVDTQDLVNKVNEMATRERMAPEDVKKINDLLNRFGQKEEVITGVKQVKPNTLDPQAEFERKQLEGLQRTQDVKEIKSQLARAGEPSLGGQQPGVFEGQGPAFGSDLLAAKSQSASPTIKAKTPYEGKGETSTIDYITSQEFKKPKLTVDDLTDLKRRLDVMTKSPDPVEAQAAIEMAQGVKNMIREAAGTDNYKMADELRKLQSEIEAKFGVGAVEGQPILTKDRQAYETKARQLTRNLVMGAEDPANLQNLQMQEGFEQLGKLLPESAKVQDQANKLAQEARTSEFLNSRKIFVNPLNPKGSLSFEPSVVKGADWFGKGAKRIHDWSENDLAQATQYLYTTGKDTYAKMLEKASMAPGEKRRALLFSLTQNPGFRNAIGGTDEENK